MEELFKKLNTVWSDLNVSVIVPIENESFDKDVNKNRVKQAIKEAGEKILDRKYDYEFLIEKMYDLFIKIDWDHPTKGIGIFVSPHISEWIYFSNPVTEKIMVGDVFETRDIVFEMTHIFRFWLLAISMNRTRLFRGESRKLTEINNEYFPLHYAEEFEFEQTPSRIRSTHGVEESNVKLEREKEYLRKVDAHLDHFLKLENLPLVIGGVKEATGLFEEISSHAKKVIGRLHGNFDYTSDSELASKAMDEITEWEKKEKEKLIDHFKEAVGAKKCVWGIKNVWKAATEGRCDTLLVEKDYVLPAMLTNDLFIVNMDGGTENLSPKTNDVVNNIISMVMSKKGKVVFADNEQLHSFDKIATLLRY